MKRVEELPIRIAVIRHASRTDRHETWRYYSILNTLRSHGAAKAEAEETTKWVCRKAKPGESREIYPGILVEIEEEDNGKV